MKFYPAVLAFASAALLLCLAVPSQVEAKPSRHGVDAFAGDRWVMLAQAGTTAADVNRVMQRRTGKARHYRTKQRRQIVPAPRPGTVAPLTLAGGAGRDVVRAMATVIGGRPAGCPVRFCGCGASLYLFGRIVPTLNLAANWLRFPRTAPAPNMVAARRGHVFVLKAHIRDNLWLVHDSNSGGRRTRVHPRSIAGYAIVNPRTG